MWGFKNRDLKNQEVDKWLAILLKLKKKGFFHLLISNYSVQLIVFASHLLIAKIMSPSDVGIIKTIETFSNMAIVLGGGGALFAILKIVPERRRRDVRNVSINFSIKYVSLFSLGVFIIFNLIAYLGLMSQDQELVNWFYVYSWIIIPTALTQLLTRYYQAIDRFKRISTMILILKLATAGFVLFFTYTFFIQGYVISMIITTIMALGVLMYDLRKELFSYTSENYQAIRQQIISLSKSAFYAQLIDQLKLHSGFLIANYVLLDRIMFGHYAFALILIQGLNIISTSVQQFIIPKMSQTSSNLKVFFSKFNFFETRFILFSIFVVVVSQLVLPTLVEIVFGDKYSEAMVLLRIMLIGWFIQSLYALKGVVFLSLGKMKYISYSSLIIFILSTPGMYLLTVNYGAKGAAMSYILQHLIGFLMLTYFTRKVANASMKL